MRVTCPSCGEDYPIEAGLLEADGKRLAAIMGEMEPALARAAISYLRLFKPPKTSLRTTRAIKLLQELQELVRAGTVSKDERTGVHRPAPVAAWVAGIEQLLKQPERLTLPLSNHNYLRHVVFGIADAADARAERQREQELRSRRELKPVDSLMPSIATPTEKLNTHLAWLRDQLDRKFITQEQYDEQAAQARAKYQQGAAQ
jgi:hypothetical protein